ncbi:HAMP domain-containing protein [Saccharopolyspora sp. NPDC000995]
MLCAVGLVLVAGSLLVADRLAARVVRAATRLANASSALGAGNFSVRVHPSGPPELVEAGRAFNTMADRVRQLLAAEREMAADLSHRLRTPLTALRLNAEALGGDQAAEHIRVAIDRLEPEVDLVITSARRSGPGEYADCDVAGLLRERLGVWSALTEDRQRPWNMRRVAESTGARLTVDRSSLGGVRVCMWLWRRPAAPTSIRRRDRRQPPAKGSGWTDVNREGAAHLEKGRSSGAG